MLAQSIAIEGPGGLNWPIWKRLVAEVEALGFAGLYSSDHFVLPPMPEDGDSLDVMTAMTYLADHSAKLEFGPLVAPLSFRDPVLLARQAMALDNLSEGRLILGLGAGWEGREHEMFGYITIPDEDRNFEGGVRAAHKIHPERWQDAPHREPYLALNRDCGTVLRQLPSQLSRKDIFSMVGSNNPMALFVYVMAWGYNNDGTGALRVNKILEPNGASTKISMAIRLASEGKIKEAFETIHGQAGVANLGTAFGSKLLYFAGFDFVLDLPLPDAQNAPVPLFFDKFVADGLMRVLDSLQGASATWDASTTKWSHYVDDLKLVSRIRDRSAPTARLDMVEHWLWLVGGWRGWHLNAIQRIHTWICSPRRATP